MPALSERQTRRIEELIAEMTLEEKVAQLTGASMYKLLGEDKQLCREKMAELLGRGIGQITLSGGATELPPERTAENANTIQRFLAEETRLGIPAIVNDECLAGYVCMGATHFPQAIGMAAAWNPELTRRMSDVIRQQARAAGSHLMYSPVVDVGRDPRWGRTEETWGEDPYLVSRIGVAFAQGLHGADLRQGVLATLKHFAAYSVSEGGRNCAPVHMGPRELREVFLLPFEAAIKEAGVQSVMAAYHDIDGVPCSGDPKLLTGILRDEWGFEGIVVADWGSVAMLHTVHHTAADLTEAGKQALSAGLDIETPGAACYSNGLIEAVRRGEFPGSVVDRAVRRHLRVKMLLGLFEQPYVAAADTRTVFDIPAHRALALEAARQSMTLLKNEGNLLPLAKDLKSIAVVGPNADSTHSLLGDYSYSVYRKLEGDAVRIVSVLQGIRDKVSPQTRVHYAKGCDVTGDSTDGFGQALRIADEADVVIAVVGGRSALHEGATSGENIDRAELNLPGMQEELLKALHRTGKPLVVVLVNGRPLAIEWAAKNAAAILEAWLPGEEGGNAVADVLFGDVNPGGKLPVSLLRTAGQVPTAYNRREASFSRRAHYAFTDRNPVFPFGHGLGYSTFAYSGLEIAPASVVDEPDVRIACHVENTGSRAGDEVVQLYVRDPVASVTRPRQELKGFCRVHLGPGEKRKLVFTLPIEQLAFYDAGMNLVVEPGEIEVMVGSSSEDIRLNGRLDLTSRREIRQRRRFATEVATFE